MVSFDRCPTQLPTLSYRKKCNTCQEAKCCPCSFVNEFPTVGASGKNYRDLSLFPNNQMSCIIKSQDEK